MSIEMMGVLQIKCASLERQVQKLALENVRVRKLLTEFARRDDVQLAKIADLAAECDAMRASVNPVGQ